MFAMMSDALYRFRCSSSGY